MHYILAVFYWVLLNLSPEVRFNFCNIKLIAIAKTKDLRETDCFALLTDFIMTINQLNSSDGLQLDVLGKIVTFFGFVGFAIGDTLALQWIGGFLEGVGKALQFCRSCHITHDERFNNFNSKYLLRDLETHQLQLKLLENSPDLSKQYGIKKSSVLLKINDFDICKGLLHDPMHVLIEGVCITEIKNLLEYTIKVKKIDLQVINKRILEFDYFFIDKDVNQMHLMRIIY